MLIIDKLWREGLSPSERHMRMNSQYRHILNKICEKEACLRSELSEDGIRCFETYNDFLGDLSAITEEEIFVDAFRLGAKFILDIWGNYNRNLYTLDGNDTQEEV